MSPSCVLARYHCNHYDGHYACNDRTYLAQGDMQVEFGRAALRSGAAGVLIWGMNADVVNDTQCNGARSYGGCVAEPLSVFAGEPCARARVSWQRRDGETRARVCAGFRPHRPHRDGQSVRVRVVH